MKHRWIASLILGAVALAVSPAHSDFDPSGRHHGRPHRPATSHHGPRNTNTTSHATASGRSPAALIARYRGLVLSRPGVPFPLRRLAELVRKRDGNLDKLITEFDKLVQRGGDEGWAAKVALAGLARMDGDKAKAIVLYREAIEQRPKQLGPVQALAEVLTDTGNITEARKLYEKLLAESKARVDKESALRTLLKLSLDQKDYEAASRYHARLVTLAQGSFFVRAELTRELLARGLYERAEQAARRLVRASRGDNRVLVLALRDLGKALVKQGKTDEATEVLRKALRLAGQSAGVRREIYRIITEAYRAEGKLPELITLLKKQRATRDFELRTTLGRLLEETGKIDEALEEYRRALRVRPKHIDTRLRVIHLLQAQGQLDEAIAEYERLIKATPASTEFVFELCDLLIQRGEREKAKRWLERLERRTRDDDQLSRLADFYEQIEEPDRAMRIWKRLANHNRTNPRFIIELGNRYFDQGDTKRAVQVWKRLPTIIRNRAKAMAALGEVYLEHDMIKDAIVALQESLRLRPKHLRTLKTFAMALERSTPSRRGLSSGRRKALLIWQQILYLAEKRGRWAQAREARLHIVASWALAGQLSREQRRLESRFRSNPTDEQSARMLVEVQVRLHQLEEAAQTLQALSARHPGDTSLLLRLERVFVLDHKLDRAIDVLQKLVKADPQRARSYYQRMAKYASELYLDDDALKYAAKAVALAPDDAIGHRKLGELYRKRQQIDKAIAEFRAAIAKNDRLFLVYFDLAKLLVGQEKLDQADELYRRVVRLCPDESLVVQAARLSMQINMGAGTLPKLERELLPTALNNPQKTVYRKLLVELYGAMTMPLIQQVRYGSKQQAATASKRLAAIGERGIKPLLDALSDDDESQQRTAIEVLGFVHNPAAGLALFAYANGQHDAELRQRAMIAVGNLQSLKLLPKLTKMLEPDMVARASAVDVAAAWSLTKLRSPRAIPTWRRLAASGSGPVRALCLLALGRERDQHSARLMVTTLQDPMAPSLARAAAALSLARLGRSDQVELLEAVSLSPDPRLQASALLALARLDSKRSVDIAAGALYSPNAHVRRAALVALVYPAAKLPWKPPDLWTPPQGPVRVEQMLDAAIPAAPPVEARAAALIALRANLQRAAILAVNTSAQGPRMVAQSLLAHGGQPSFTPFTDEIEKLSAERRDAALQAARQITVHVTPTFTTLTKHPSVQMRRLAIRVLALGGIEEQRSLFVSALSDPNETVRALALDLLGEAKNAATTKAVASVLREAKQWSLRLRAAKVLGAYRGRLPSPAIEALRSAAEHDHFALVRLACIDALRSDPGSRPLLKRIAKNDVEPEVREAAARDESRSAEFHGSH